MAVFATLFLQTATSPTESETASNTSNPIGDKPKSNALSNIFFKIKNIAKKVAKGASATVANIGKNIKDTVNKVTKKIDAKVKSSKTQVIQAIENLKIATTKAIKEAHEHIKEIVNSLEHTFDEYDTQSSDKINTDTEQLLKSVIYTSEKALATIKKAAYDTLSDTCSKKLQDPIKTICWIEKYEVSMSYVHQGFKKAIANNNFGTLKKIVAFMFKAKQGFVEDTPEVIQWLGDNEYVKKTFLENLKIIFSNADIIIEKVKEDEKSASIINQNVTQLTIEVIHSSEKAYAALEKVVAGVMSNDKKKQLLIKMQDWTWDFGDQMRTAQNMLEEFFKTETLQDFSKTLALMKKTKEQIEGHLQKIYEECFKDNEEQGKTWLNNIQCMLNNASKVDIKIRETVLKAHESGFIDVHAIEQNIDKCHSDIQKAYTAMNKALLDAMDQATNYENKQLLIKGRDWMDNFGGVITKVYNSLKESTISNTPVEYCKVLANMNKDVDDTEAQLQKIHDYFVSSKELGKTYLKNIRRILYFAREFDLQLSETILKAFESEPIDVCETEQYILECYMATQKVYTALKKSVSDAISQAANEKNKQLLIKAYNWIEKFGNVITKVHDSFEISTVINTPIDYYKALADMDIEIEDTEAQSQKIHDECFEGSKEQGNEFLKHIQIILNGAREFSINMREVILKAHESASTNHQQ